MHKYGVEQKIADWICVVFGVYAALVVEDWAVARVLLTRPLFTLVYHILYRMIILKIEDMVIEEMRIEYWKELDALCEKIKQREYDSIQIDWE